MHTAESLLSVDNAEDYAVSHGHSLYNPLLEETINLKLLSYNIQSGIETYKYRHYLTRSWRHVFPNAERQQNLQQISELINEYDIVALQEVDAGSLRSRFVNQTEYLAEQAYFPHWYDLTNRNLGMLAQQSIGLLSRVKCSQVMEHKLPGFIPGRGALMVHLGNDSNPLLLVTLHLALGRRARRRQLQYVADIVKEYQYAIVMGDMNCVADSHEMTILEDRAGLQQPDDSNLYTFPSWRPFRNIDQILVTPNISVRDVSVLNYPLSDHLPLSMDIELPRSIIQ
ncbi:MAG: endonuclease/exonuclease/phosphatase family protein [Gammaproteobacteria bacterium]|nr:MAG: endonuclease/exonuclease/phosphatase family protein [Gammaproteobacteria bacterium]